MSTKSSYPMYDIDNVRKIVSQIRVLLQNQPGNEFNILKSLYVGSFFEGVKAEKDFLKEEPSNV